MLHIRGISMPRTPFEDRKRTNKLETGQATTKRKTFRENDTKAPTFDECNPLVLSAIVCLCTTYGCSPTFSYTRNGTSLVIALYYKGERTVDYLSGPDEMNEWFKWLVEDKLDVSHEDMIPYALLTSDKA